MRNIGDWDNINDREIIYQYINEKMRDGIYVSHILKVLEEKIENGVITKEGLILDTLEQGGYLKEAGLKIWD